jgi:cell division protein FtsN
LTRKGVGIWLCLIFFISAWMFILGILVGRGTAPVHFDMEKLQKELAALKKQVIKKEQDQFKIDSKAASNKQDLGFYEALKDIKDEAVPHSPIFEQKKRPEKTVAIKTSSVTAKTSSEVKSGKNLTIQVASLKNLKTADEFVANLNKKGYPAYRTIVKIPKKGTWYRVRIGRFRNKAEAAITLNRLKKEKLKGILIKL